MNKHKEVQLELRTLLNSKNLNEGFTPKRRAFSHRVGDKHGFINWKGKGHTKTFRHDHQHTKTFRHDHQNVSGKIRDQNEIELRSSIRSKEVQWGFLKLEERPKSSKEKIKGYVEEILNLRSSSKNKEEKNKLIEQILQEKEKHNKGLLFINNTNFEPIKGEEDRTMYYDIKDIEVQLDDHTKVTIPVAFNFDHVTKAPIFPEVRIYEEGNKKWVKKDIGEIP